ncbi:uncharacterized protein MONOS_8929 [Monocercomonoides exilis]|uniref:uncharacterized protein n=1 Tax=Monocercomonoides exilis TaxID=2049356 RepID=UPI0035599E32|nr:hypothetical protein MONOS_8929 [Monocercomonoides exilis]|eukprot:MONOS_8929.1-p1 / transcript=MONOS_8929.1 / gene=MONOS_8929 / organism=Monocercomonoides_exilis_PA203 / gene_product=unspecified product / transcript_product=unspecified product / location=Mono_scaffold00351:48703-50619(+) / protein_length=441 / sequence_SO=supercontig / SO=protein_coding / is_pseudo=false
MDVFDASLEGPRRLQFYLSHVSYCLPDLQLDSSLLDFSTEPTEATAAKIVKACRVYSPETFYGKILFEKPNDDPWLQGRSSQVYDIETALSFTDERRITIGTRRVHIHNVVVHTAEWITSWYIEPLNSEAWRADELAANATQQVQFNPPASTFAELDEYQGLGLDANSQESGIDSRSSVMTETSMLSKAPTTRTGTGTNTLPSTITTGTRPLTATLASTQMVKPKEATATITTTTAAGAAAGAAVGAAAAAAGGKEGAAGEKAEEGEKGKSVKDPPEDEKKKKEEEDKKKENEKKGGKNEKRGDKKDVKGKGKGKGKKGAESSSSESESSSSSEYSSSSSYSSSYSSEEDLKKRKRKKSGKLGILQQDDLFRPSDFFSAMLFYIMLFVAGVVAALSITSALTGTETMDQLSNFFNSMQWVTCALLLTAVFLIWSISSLGA